MNLSPLIDHTILKPTTTLAEINQLCNEAEEYGFATVCIPPPFVKRVSTILLSTAVKVSTVIGFPFGYAATEAKLSEAILAISDGADELDIVINLIALRMNDWDFLVKEVKSLRDLIKHKGKTVKVIIESGILTDDEIIKCCTTIGTLKIDYMKTSTGYAEKGASVNAVKLMRTHLPSDVKIKASGGIRTYDFAKTLYEAGAERLGCSASVAIVQGAPDFL